MRTEEEVRGMLAYLEGRQRLSGMGTQINYSYMQAIMWVLGQPNTLDGSVYDDDEEEEEEGEES